MRLFSSLLTTRQRAALLLALIVLFSLPSRQLAAQEETYHFGTKEPERTTYIALDFGLGGLQLANDYLTPLHYGGKFYGLNSTLEAPITKSKPLFLRLATQLAYGATLNPAHNAMMQSVRFSLQGELHYLFTLPYNIHLSFGGGIRTLFGGNLLPQNVNNIADGDFKLDVLAATQVAYRLPIRCFPMQLRLYGSLGIMGIAHQVGYNESYYEMLYLNGGFARSLHFSHWGNSVHGAILFAIDLPISNFITLRLGYSFDTDWQRLQNRSRRLDAHGAFIGFSFETLWFAGREAQQGDGHRAILYP